jgi:hypothetical protein
VAQFQRLTWPVLSCPSLVGARERERRVRAGSGLAQATGVWGRAAVLERAAAMIGGRFGGGDVRKRCLQDLARCCIGTMQFPPPTSDKHETAAMHQVAGT